MKVFGMCINKKVVGGLVVAALGIWWLAPAAIGAALPLLVLALCPLSMLFMMMSMSNLQSRQQAAPPVAGTPAPAPPTEAASAAAPVNDTAASTVARSDGDAC